MAQQILRPMEYGDLLDEMFELYKKNFLLFTGICGVVFLPIYLLAYGLAGMQGASWVAHQVNQEGFLGDNRDLGCYYKRVYPLRVSGYSFQAGILLKRIIELFYTESGDLRNPDGRKTSGTYTSAFCQVYPNGWVTLGAHQLGRFDVVRQLMKGVMDNYYDEEMGTFRCSANPRVDKFDVNSAAMAVELFTLWDIEKAKRAVDIPV